MGVFSLSRPLTSENAAISAPSTRTTKLKLEYGFLFVRSVAMGFLAIRLPRRLGCRRARRELSDLEDDEFGRERRRHADKDDESPVVDLLFGHRRAVDLDEVGLLRLGSHERARLPNAEQEGLYRRLHA